MKKTFKLYQIAGLVMVLGVIFNLVACGNKSSSSSPSYPVPPYNIPPGCVNCGVNGGEIYRGESQGFNGSNVSIAFYANSNSAMTTNSLYSYPGYQNSMLDPVNYYGSVSAQGVMTLPSLPYGFCNLPGGSYSVTTVQPGTWGAATFMGIRVQLSGPSQMVGYLSGAVGAKSSQYWGYTWQEMPMPRTGPIYGGQLLIETINGMSCSLPVSF